MRDDDIGSVSIDESSYFRTKDAEFFVRESAPV